MSKLVQGVGINDGKYTATIKGVNKKEYEIWRGMLQRCYNTKVQKMRPTYIGCSVSDNFKYYTYFFEWCQLQIGFFNTGYELDKDILNKGNKIYGENSCIFIPSELNSLIRVCKGNRGITPIGVTKREDNFQAQCSINNISKKLGTFKTPELAFNAYKTFKEAHIKELAEKYKDTIDPRAYQALLNYEVSIDD